MTPKTLKIEDLIAKYTVHPEAKAQFDQGKVRLMTAYQFMKAREAGLSQRDLATAAGVPEREIARVELGERTSLDILSKIAVALGKTLDVTLVDD
ncbi:MULTISPECIES: multiprotein-bridging factor 1 family protein [Lacticaseibacillus]|uniref:Transcriptional regulator n=2 Tax=Lacticaseibacillus TaxID=2759736 RepID=A0AAN1C5V4_LACCA|nr:MULTISPECIES: helix-turn-helix transcriptional regulator [Lacticaseibacillus]ARY90323.1 transcriptional regulator [Lacticaseibacillus casei]KAB1969934.1 helix-turn-helix transcriptional regulator [Lacticaseibacillus casei]WLV80939.1 helix-turn-helix transcriptional regulator [Lacticaseibacillus sp. NCIMB 15473]WNX24898.1 helix-turn-helix transcriptional regulator [Lacticaseibacillus casei]WNX27670.1 helix-turn-helix transcriptional regulator [Lacticaseibacillus casei]